MPSYAENYAYNHISTQTTTLVKAGSGVLHSVSINTPLSPGVATIFDSLTGSGTVIAVISSTGTIPSSVIYDLRFNIGCTIVTSAATQDITVTFK